MAKRGLGKGLGALIPNLGNSENVRFEELALDAILPNPNQPRKNFEEEAFNDLVSSIKEVGLVQPIVVRPSSNGFMIVAGERRWRAAREAGLTMIPALIRDSSESESLELALIENIQREDLNAIEEAMAYRRLIDEFELTQAEMANRVGKSRVSITNTLRLLQLPESVKGMIADCMLTAGHAKVLLGLPDQASQELLALRAVEEGLSVRALERIIRQMMDREQPSQDRQTRRVEEYHREIADGMERILGSRVVVYETQSKGTVQIQFKNRGDLERIFNLISNQARDDQTFLGS